MYLIKGQINRDADALHRAEQDMTRAIELVSKDPSNLRAWRDSLESIRVVQRILTAATPTPATVEPQASPSTPPKSEMGRE